MVKIESNSKRELHPKLAELQAKSGLSEKQINLITETQIGGLASEIAEIKAEGSTYGKSDLDIDLKPNQADNPDNYPNVHKEVEIEQKKPSVDDKEIEVKKAVGFLESIGIGNVGGIFVNLADKAKKDSSGLQNDLANHPKYQ